MFIEQTKIFSGIDDATKCPVIGSIFLAGVTADQKTIDYWKSIGIKDSKLIAPKKRESLAKVIKETATKYCIKEITPQMIDDKSLNLNDWEMLVFLNIVKNLIKDTNVEQVIVDNWETSSNGFYARLNKLLDKSNKEILKKKKFIFNSSQLLNLNYLPEHRADENHVIVGAASILAKTASDAQYRKYKKIYGDFGSGSPADPKTRLYVWQNINKENPIIRKSWNTYKTLSQLADINQDFIYSKINREKS